MPKFEVSYTHVIERRVTCLVEAQTEDEAIEKAQDGDFLSDDADEAPEEGLETKDYEAVEVEE